MSRATRRFLVCSCMLVALALMLEAVPRATAGEKIKIRYSTFLDHKDLRNAGDRWAGQKSWRSGSGANRTSFTTTGWARFCLW